MIKDRPTQLLNQPDYKKLPAKPFSVNFQALPDLVKESLGPLGGIQPVTGAMSKAANGHLRDMPSEAEIELFREMDMGRGCGKVVKYPQYELRRRCPTSLIASQPHCPILTGWR